MIHCPYFLSDNRCLVASQIAGCAVNANAVACEACQSNGPPGANVITIELAVAQRQRLAKSTDELERMLLEHTSVSVTSDSPPSHPARPGPGSELKRMLSWFAHSNDQCNCDTRADTMNDWGAEGCRQNLDTIVEWLLEEAQLRGLPHGRFTNVIARSLIITAIGRFERKFPDGAPEPNDNDPDEEDR